MSEPALDAFTTALRAEIDAVVARYHALAVAREEALRAELARRSAEVTALRAERDELRGERDEQETRDAERRAEIERLSVEIKELGRELELSRAREGELTAAARSAAAASQALEAQFAAERAFEVACRGLSGSLLGEALRGAVGRDLDATPETYAALKARGLEAVLIGALRERGRSVVQAPLLERERSALAAIAAAAGCELTTPPSGTKFSASTMDKASTAVEPAEEGNVVECLLPGIRRRGTEGALLFPRVVVATG